MTSASPNRGVMIVLAYLWPLAIVPLVVEKQDAEVQWHARHGLVLMAAELVLLFAVSVLTGMASMAMLTGLDGMRPSSAEWQPSDSNSLARRNRMEGRPIHGLKSFRLIATTFLLTTRAGKRLRPVLGNWILCSPRSALPSEFMFGRSTPRISGDRVITAVLK